MATDKSIRRFRSWYAILLRLYPKAYHHRFGEPMEQTFNDLLRERAKEEKRFFSFVLWMFAETFVGAIVENMTVIITRYRALIRILLMTALILLLPLIAMRFTDEVVWNLADFAVAGVLLIGAGLTFELIARNAGSFAYRVAVGIAIAAALLLIWINLAVGIIGNEGNPANLMYLGVLAVGIVGAVVARFQPHGMARALFAMALAQVLIAVIAVITGLGQTFVMTGFFVALWLTSAWLFRRSGKEPISKA